MDRCGPRPASLASLVGFRPVKNSFKEVPKAGHPKLPTPQHTYKYQCITDLVLMSPFMSPELSQDPGE